MHALESNQALFHIYIHLFCTVLHTLLCERLLYLRQDVQTRFDSMYFVPDTLEHSWSLKNQQQLQLCGILTKDSNDLALQPLSLQKSKGMLGFVLIAHGLVCFQLAYFPGAFPLRNNTFGIVVILNRHLAYITVYMYYICYICYVMLCCVMLLCYVMLCYVMLCYVMLCYVMLC